jgi:hypothetical protein
MGLFDNESTTTGTPWGPLQQPTLGGVNYIQNLLQQGPWGGPYTAPIDPLQTQGIQQGAAAAGGAGGIANAYQQQGQGLLPGMQQGFGYFGSALAGGMNPWVTNPQQYLGIAQNVANNPYMDSMVTSALRDPFRQLTEQMLPGIRSGANMAGQAGGSQEAVMSAIANRGYADRAADVGAQMRGGAYSQGLGFANQAAQSDMALQQAAAQNLFNMGQMGLGFLGQGYGIGQQGAQDTFNWGTQGQGLQNQQLQGQMAQFMAPWELAKSYGSYINPLAGSLQQRTSSQDMLPAYLLQGLGPILSAGGGAAGQWLFGTPGVNGQPGTPGNLGRLLGKIPGLGGIFGDG